MNCNTTHYRANSSSVPGDPTAFSEFLGASTARTLEHAPWQLTVPDDDRPFFAHGFRVGALPALLREHGRELIPYMDVAWLLQAAALVTATLLGVLLLLPPCLVAAAAPPARTLLVFLALGVGYMAVELWAIHRLRSFLSHDSHAAALTLGVMLAGSGLGALLLAARPPRAALAALPVALLLLLASAPLLVRTGFALELAPRMLIAASWLLLPAILMGVPFPTALARIDEPAVPWALAMNGFGSVLGALAAGLIALELGFDALALVALGAYAIALLLFPAPAHRTR